MVPSLTKGQGNVNGWIFIAAVSAGRGGISFHERCDAGDSLEVAFDCWRTSNFTDFPVSTDRALKNATTLACDRIESNVADTLAGRCRRRNGGRGHDLIQG